MEPKSSTPCSQQRSTCPYPMLYGFRPRPHIPFREDPFKYYPPISPSSPPHGIFPTDFAIKTKRAASHIHLFSLNPGYKSRNSSWCDILQPSLTSCAADWTADRSCFDSWQGRARVFVFNAPWKPPIQWPCVTFRSTWFNTFYMLTNKFSAMQFNIILKNSLSRNIRSLVLELTLR